MLMLFEKLLKYDKATNLIKEILAIISLVLAGASVFGIFLNWFIESVMLRNMSIAGLLAGILGILLFGREYREHIVDFILEFITWY